MTNQSSSKGLLRDSAATSGASAPLSSEDARLVRRGRRHLVGAWVVGEMLSEWKSGEVKGRLQEAPAPAAGRLAQRATLHSANAPEEGAVMSTDNIIRAWREL